MARIARKEQAQEPTYSKEQLLAAKKPLWNKDVLAVALEEDKEYTLDEVEKTIEKYLKREVV